MSYQPKTGQKCSCRPGVWRDNCPNCEGTGWVVDFAAIRSKGVKTMNNTRADYMAGRIDHQTYYLGLADAIGRSYIERLVLHIAPLEKIRECLKSDENLNNISLHSWDSMHSSVLDIVKRNGPKIMAISWNGTQLSPNTISWSMSESVCVLKAAARRMAEEHSEL